ncbi:DUF1772 domain-containing protein [Nocardioides currus]|nr:anthrone oxygenase family protein [Nocardioides currus]
MILTLLTPTLLTATVMTGLTAGFLAAFAHTVMTGLAATDDTTYVGAFQAIDKAVTNPWFLVPFTLGPVLVAAALLMLLSHRQWGAALLVGVALALAVVTFVITGVVHLPLNSELQDVALGSSGLAEARARFAERWIPWNVVRTVTSTGSFVALSVALLRVR